MRVGVGRSHPRIINEYSQTWRLQLRNNRPCWPRRKHTPTDKGRMEAVSRSVQGRKKFYAWKVDMNLIEARFRSEHGWKVRIPIRAYGPEMKR